ncbi:hypothetical protein [Methanoplanus endosymbiosus]|uniref:Uncharacterized protein n=1 Tax=Methanoplanus endosymbiosus TaxID=33865 RepID=A0A9E7TJB7_9EURY|nr:hypothetical protein [Methanoplanus endosymbiosus]UUX93463.1 hypothetical protein L6E24_04910 [Methanoplanus endosymbiosus]
MKFFVREEALSEVVGFILILGLLTIAMSMYVVYEVPVQGEMDEIDHMNGIKDRFVDYKISLDSLWINSLGVENSGANVNFSPYGINLGTSFVMGTGGGFKTGGSGIAPLFFPVPSAGYMTVNQSDGHILITKNNDAANPVFDKDIGKMSYNSQNNYWLDQEYYYQMGGVFLKQTDGVTARVDPTVSFYGLDGGTKLGVYIIPVSVKCPTISQSVGGSGPVMADTRYKNEGQYPPGTVSAQSVQIELTVKDSLEAVVWKKVFQSALWREGVYNPDWYDITFPGSRSVKIDILGPPGSTGDDVQLSIYNANFSVTLQNVASSLE